MMTDHYNIVYLHTLGTKKKKKIALTINNYRKNRFCPLVGDPHHPPPLLVECKGTKIIIISKRTRPLWLIDAHTRYVMYLFFTCRFRQIIILLLLLLKSIVADVISDWSG